MHQLHGCVSDCDYLQSFIGEKDPIIQQRRHLFEWLFRACTLIQQNNTADLRAAYDSHVLEMKKSMANYIVEVTLFIAKH